MSLRTTRRLVQAPLNLLRRNTVPLFVSSMVAAACFGSGETSLPGGGSAGKSPTGGGTTSGGSGGAGPTSTTTSTTTSTSTIGTTGTGGAAGSGTTGMGGRGGTA